MSGARQAVLASALAPLAVLAVVVAGVSAVVVLPGDDGGSGPDDPVTAASSASPTDEPDDRPTAPEGQQLVEGSSLAYAVLLVPDTGEWTLADGTGISYPAPDPDEGTDVGVTSPAYFREGFCEEEQGTLYRALVGLSDVTSAEGRTVQEAAQDAADAWADAVRGSEGSTPSVTPVRLDDGSAGWTGAEVVPVEDSESACSPPAREIRVVSVASGTEVATAVLLRDVRADGDDLRDGLSADEADEVLRTLAPL